MSIFDRLHDNLSVTPVDKTYVRSQSKCADVRPLIPRAAMEFNSGSGPVLERVKPHLAKCPDCAYDFHVYINEQDDRPAA